MKKIMSRCKHCRCLFQVCNKVKKHDYCGKKKCQQARKAKWHKDKLKNDDVYRNDQTIARQDWLKKNPDYWKNYRRKHVKYTEGNREKQRHRNIVRRANRAPAAISDSIAKMDALSFQKSAITGRYKLVPVKSERIANMDPLIVEIKTISRGFASSGGMVANMDM